ncbi:putative Rpc40-40 kd subunit of DNA-directed RNA polymerases I and III [Violaceomyces palustris]|uniref:Rpc40-40 kd subunit of DNA-directed RNA polymerases I and III n=1 Tax=Violaceomyces palustris TaxID=1673888 RepID=A0ACD0NXJ2_9BASI|nr:putative Rpc40-40 kd subunit of DNA-directed RNA polymerases I and III [Violaceomyces palustris]
MAPRTKKVDDMDLDPSPSTSSRAQIVASSSASEPVDKRRLVEILPERVGSVASTDFPNHYPGELHEWDLERFRSNLKVAITRLSSGQCEFDLVGVDASVANAIRRVLMSEVPTVAIEHVYVWNNTSIIQDEVLSHRLGLVPLKIDPDRITMRNPGDDADDQNTVVFNLKQKCERNPKAAKGETDPEKLYIGSNVYSSALVWDPKGDQEEDLADCPPRPVHDDILLAKLRPGQELELELHCEKGIGKDHAKFSPVATATYRLLPHIQILKPIPPHLCEKFRKCFPEGVIGIRGGEGEQEVYVKDARRDTVSREVLRYPEFEGHVKLGRVRDHFLFDLETSGIIAPEKLLPTAIKVLREKIAILKSGLDHMERAKGLTGAGDE